MCGKEARLARSVLVLLTLALGLAVVVTECSLELASRDPLLETMDAARARGLAYDTRTKGEVVAALRSSGVDAVPFVAPEWLLREQSGGYLAPRGAILPLAGVPLRTTVLCNESGVFAVFQSDRYGFRNPDGVWDRAVTDLVLIGDSFTIGDCIEDDETIASRLAARGLRVTNLGVAGIGPLFELAVLREYGPRLRPRVVVWLYCENDLDDFDLGLERRAPLLLRYLDAGFSQGLADRSRDVEATLNRFLADASPSLASESAADRALAVERNTGLRIGRVLSLRQLRLRLRAVRHVLRPEPPRSVDLKLFERVLAQAAADVRPWGARSVFVFIPSVGTVRSTRGAEARHATRARVLAVARVAGYEVVDLLPAFATAPDPGALYAFPGNSEFAGAPHFSPRGSELAAREIARAMAAPPRP